MYIFLKNLKGKGKEEEDIFKEPLKTDLGKDPKTVILTLSRESARQIVAVVHMDSARASSAAANFAPTFYQSSVIVSK